MPWTGSPSRAWLVKTSLHRETSGKSVRTQKALCGATSLTYLVGFSPIFQCIILTVQFE